MANTTVKVISVFDMRAHSLANSNCYIVHILIQKVNGTFTRNGSSTTNGLPTEPALKTETDLTRERLEDYIASPTQRERGNTIWDEQNEKIETKSKNVESTSL